MGQNASTLALYHYAALNVLNDHIEYSLSKNIISTDPFTIRDTKFGKEFKVSQPGITFDIVTINITYKKKSIVHYGLLCTGNTFITPDGEYDMCLVHRIAENVNVIFADDETPLFKCFCEAIHGTKCSPVTKMRIGEAVKEASTYAAILRKEMSLIFNIRMTNPKKETNCMAFAARAIRTLEFPRGHMSVSCFQKNLVSDGWDADFADMNCKYLNVLLGEETVYNEDYAVSVLNSFINDDSLAAFQVRPPVHPEPTDYITIAVKGLLGDLVPYKVIMNAPLRKVMKHYTKHKALDESTIEFLFDGYFLASGNTPMQLKMKDKDEIELYRKDGGWGDYADWRHAIVW